MPDVPASASASASATITVIGEALIDLVPHGEPGDYRARPGGSPLNVAIGLARLGHRTALMARLADNAFGRLLRKHAADEGVDLTHAPHATEPTTLAIVSLDAEARAAYDFYLDATADWQWTAAEAADLPPDTSVLHFGSLAAWTVPGHDRIHAAVSELHRQDSVLISYDPNVRPQLLGDHVKARPQIERCVSVAHLVKASRDDLAWLYPETPLERIAERWLALGPALVVVTDGPDGAYLFQPNTGPTHRPGRKIQLVDTIGAGDAFTAGLLSSLVLRNVRTPEQLRGCAPDLLSAALDDAILVSALTCERVGADPPTLADLRLATPRV